MNDTNEFKVIWHCYECFKIKEVWRGSPDVYLEVPKDFYVHHANGERIDEYWFGTIQQCKAFINGMCYILKDT